MKKNTLNLHLSTDKDLIPRDVPAQRVLEISVQAPVSETQVSRAPLNLALVLDRSGSMHGAKLDYVKQAAAHVVDLLQEGDQVAIVSYDDEIQVLSPSVHGTGQNRQELKRLIQHIHTGGSTNLGGGWLAGCQEAASAAGEGTLNRALLLTDGLANVGITDLEELSGHAKELSRRGVSTSTFGVGLDFNEHLLEAMANAGGGNYYFIESPLGIPDLFVKEFKELAAVTARDVELTISIPPHVTVEVLGGWKNELSGGRLRIDLGSLFSGQSQEIYLKLLTPPSDSQEELVVHAKLLGKIQSGEVCEDQAAVSFRYVEAEMLAAAPRNREVMLRFALVNLAEVANQALKLERHGETERASALLKQAIEEYREFLDPLELERYERLAERMQRGMQEYDRKQSQYTSYSQRRRRDN